MTATEKKYLVKGIELEQIARKTKGKLFQIAKEKGYDVLKYWELLDVAVQTKLVLPDVKLETHDELVDIRFEGISGFVFPVIDEYGF